MTYLDARALKTPLLLVICLLAPQANRSDPTVSQKVPGHRDGPDAAVKARISEAYGRLPLSFEANRGQTDAHVDFISRGSGYTLFVKPTEAVFALSSAPQERDTRNEQADSHVASRALPPQSAKSETTMLRMKLIGGNAAAQPEGGEELPGKVNYLLGNNPARWSTSIPTYAQVSYEDVYPGIDLVYYGNNRQLEYDFIVGAGADPGAIALTFEGAETLAVDGEGNLILNTGAGQLTQRAPSVYQEIEGVRQHIPGRYTLHEIRAAASRPRSGVLDADRQMVRFDVGRYDRRRPLVIDPVLVYATYLGPNDEGQGIDVDSAGNAYVTGETLSSDFPTTPGAFDMTPNGGRDAFVVKLDASGTALEYATYLGGSGSDYGLEIAVDSAGSAYVAGITDSSDFPTTPGAFDRTHASQDDAFVTKLDPSGAALTYSTYLGGSGVELRTGIVVDSAGNAYVTGGTGSINFPTTPGAFDTTLNGTRDAFVTKVAASGAALVYSTYLGGSFLDFGMAIAVDGSGSAYVTGFTFSSDFPATPGAFDTTYGEGGHRDAFVTKLAPNGSALAYSTYLGGSHSDAGSGVAVDSAGSAYVTGVTYASDFPTTPGAFDITHGGGSEVADAFVVKLEANGATLVYSTYVGGSGAEGDYPNIALDGADSAYVTGTTQSADFPITPGALGTIEPGGQDAFVTKLEASGAALAYSTYLGGSSLDYGIGIAVDSAGNGYVTGATASSDFPTTPGAFNRTHGVSYNAFVAKIFAPSQPDLVETALSNPPAAVVLKQKFPVTDSTHSQGSAAGATTTRYYLSLDTVRNAGDQVLSGQRAVPALAAGATSTGTVTVTVPTSTKVGFYYVLACADDLKASAERDESNNCRVSTTVVEVRAPDLVETAVSNPPATASPGSSFPVTDTVDSQGNAPPDASTTRYYLSLDTKKAARDPRLTGTRSVPALGVGGSSAGTITVTIPASTASGTYYVLACGDDLKKVAESNEKNNCKASATRVMVSP